jgi:nucleotide-binding universal stress UspA family protein
MWNTIVVPHDFSESAHEAARIARDEARLHGGRVLLLHVIDLPPELIPETVVMEDNAPISFRDHALATARARLAEVAEGLGIPEDQVVVRIGSPEEEILRFAGDVDADVVVMTAQGAGVRQVLAERVVRMCEVPVLVVPAVAA